jgi:hypothetical protein
MTQICQRTMRWLPSLLLVILIGAYAHGQAGSQGAISITVSDSTGGQIPAASLELIEKATNYPQRAVTTEKGTYTFVNLNIGDYQLTVSKAGYATTVLESVTVHSSQTTDVVAPLKVGKAEETVSVSADMTPLLEVSSNSIGSVIDLKWIEDLPVVGRNLTALALLTPGFTGNVTGGAGQTLGFGVWNGQPFSNQSSNVDGTVGGPTRGKYNGDVSPSATPRVENIAEMSVQTDQIDLDQGFGQATMAVNYVTRSGTNKYHGRLYVDARNSGLFANTYSHNVSGLSRTKVIWNDFGGSADGPILHDKLFFFGSLSTRRIPGGLDNSNNYLTSAMQGGDYTYTGTDNALHTVNLLTLAQQYNLGNGTTLPTSVNSEIASQFSAINTAVASGATLSTSDSNINEVDWQSSAPNIYYYPTIKLDYNLSNKVRMNLAWNMTNQTQKGAYAPPFPGSDFSEQGGQYHTRGYAASYGLDWNIKPTLVNQLKVGFLYNVHQYATDAKPLYATEPYVAWGLDNYGYNYAMSGQQYTLPTTNYYPVFNVSDSVSWQKGSHSMKMGFSWYREQDHYWNPPAGFPYMGLGVVSGDPAASAVTNASSTTNCADAPLPCASSSSMGEAQQMYAILTGRISWAYGNNRYDQKTNSYSSAGDIGAYNLDERQSAWGLFFQDSWKATPSLTLNYGLRWDFTGDNYDLTGAYHNVSEASIYGPSGIGNLFNPGSFEGTDTPTIDAHPHAYAPWKVAPQPALGLAWNPKDVSGLLGRMMGDGKTVLRAGYSLRNFTVPQQYFWDNASAYGSFFYQTFYLNPNTTGEAGTFAPGSLSLGDTMPTYGLSPAAYVTSEALSDFTFTNSLSVTGIDPHIKQPYTQSWNVGFERQLGNGALEVRYQGNRTLHQWLAINPNEVNVFENGFLDEFKKAQANLTANETAGLASFANNGLSGQSDLPIMTAAFTGESANSVDGSAEDFANGDFINDLQTGQVGAMASALSGVSGTTTYFCNLVGSSFAPCVNNAGYTGSGAGYATNFFQANPYAAGQSTSYMKAIGYSNYNSLQVDYRQQMWKGLAFDANYTYGKTLAIGSTRNWTGGGDNIMTLRNMRRGYGPTPFDIHHVMHLSGTYDLPFGKGKAFLNQGGLISRLADNWTLGSVIVFQSGAAQQIYGGNSTYNDYADGGITLNGVTAKQLQKAIGVHRIPGTSRAMLIDPKYLSTSTGGAANSAYINPNTTPGTIGDVVYLYGPHAFYHDLSISKAVPIREGINFKLQSEFLNVWNHPVFGSTPYSFGSNVQSTQFAQGSVTNNPRWIELRANIEF